MALIVSGERTGILRLSNNYEKMQVINHPVNATTETMNGYCYNDDRVIVNRYIGTEIDTHIIKIV